MRADLDGSNPEVVIAHPFPEPIGFPYGAAVDPGGGKFYWSDTAFGGIRRADLNGTNVEDVFLGSRSRASRSIS